MGVNKGRDRHRDFEDLNERAAVDFDPENDEHLQAGDESEAASSDGDEQPSRRAHYAAVEKSKLRKAKDTALGPQYRGSRTSRNALANADLDDEDDPFSRGFDDSESDEVNMDEVDEDQEDSNMSEDVEDEADLDEDDLHGDNDADAATEDTEMSEEATIPTAAIDKTELRRAMASERTSTTGAIASAQKADAEKGRAVLKQRATFDALLNARSKLQKSLIATNSIVAMKDAELKDLLNDQDAVVNKAEAAAMNLWNSLSQLRQQVNTSHSVSSGNTATISSQKLYDQLEEHEEASRPQRNAVLQKWSMKSRDVNTTSQQGKLNDQQPATIVDVLNEHLASSDRLLKKARTPRSCAPIQLANRVNEDIHIYDDADFYGMLLKELLEAKSSAASAAATNVDLTSLATMRRDAKTRRNVDTKASKGRKLRYTVHEKLQNYCAPEDRTNWGERQVEELFSSLFGQQANLAEEAQSDEDVDMDGGHSELPLFRT